VGFTWIIEEVDQNSEDKKQLHVFSAQQGDFDSSELNGSRTNTKWRLNQMAKQYHIDYWAKLRSVFMDGWLRVKGFGGLVFRQLSKVCDRTDMQWVICSQHSKRCLSLDQDWVVTPSVYTNIGTEISSSEQLISENVFDFLRSARCSRWQNFDLSFKLGFL